MLSGTHQSETFVSKAVMLGSPVEGARQLLLLLHDGNIKKVDAAL